MDKLIGDNFGLIHLISGIVALVFGGLVILMKKGTKIHKRIGYVYAFSMTVLILSSFGIYRLFGKFGLFHYLSLVSTFSLVAGMLPMFKKVRTVKDYEIHFKRMYWSVVGLFAAFTAESFVRIPKFGSFWAAVAWSFALIFVVCFITFIKMRPVWSDKFGIGKNKISDNVDN
jgi:uncharacterized membrane protein